MKGLDRVGYWKPNYSIGATLIGLVVLPLDNLGY
jgi:hypothetical protein